MRFMIRLSIAAVLALGLTAALAPVFADDSPAATEPQGGDSATQDSGQTKNPDAMDMSQDPAPKSEDTGSGSGEPEGRSEADQEWIQSIWTTP